MHPECAILEAQSTSHVGLAGQVRDARQSEAIRAICGACPGRPLVSSVSVPRTSFRYIRSLHSPGKCFRSLHPVRTPGLRVYPALFAFVRLEIPILIDACGMRNILTHLYDAIDLDRVIAAVDPALALYREYLDWALEETASWK